MREPMVAVTAIVPLPDPAAGLSVNHVAFAVAFQINVPPPLFVTARVCAAGLPAFC